MTSIVDLLKHEEGFSEKPYYDSEGYPTAGIGILLGPKGTPLSAYSFTVPLVVAEVWTQTFVDQLMHMIDTNPKYLAIKAALRRCVTAVGGYPLTVTTPYYTSPRAAVILSMAYQMGPDKLAAFQNTLALVSQGQWNDAADNMLKSKWAQQTPNRAKRHADQLRSNSWDVNY